MIIRSNLGSLMANNSMIRTSKKLDSSAAKLSSGMRINSAMDDAAGLSIGMNLKSKVSALDNTKRTIMSYMSEIDLAESKLSDISNALQRIDELRMQSTNGVYSDTELEFLELEAKELEQTCIELGESLSPLALSLIKGGGTSTSGAVNRVSNDINTFAVGKPNKVSATQVTANTITLGWEAPSKGDVKEYIIIQDGKEVGRTTDLEYKSTGLKQNTIYSFKIQAVGEDGTTSAPVNLSVRTKPGSDGESDGGGGNESGGVGDILNPDSEEASKASRQSVMDARVKLGALRNRLSTALESTIDSHENFSMAMSRVMDVNIADEYAKYNIETLRMNVINNISKQVLDNKKSISDLLLR